MRTGAVLGTMLAAIAAQGCAKKHDLIPATTPTASPTPATSSSPLALLVPGTTNQYTGTQTAVVTFASPSATTPNSNAAYSIAETDTVSAVSSGEPAPFDVHRTLTYSVTTAASYGVAPATLTQDLYENLTSASSGTQTVTLSEIDGSSTGTNLTSVLANGGTGADAASTTTKYSPAQTLATYPLTSGTTFAQTLARVATEQETVATSSGSESDNLSTTFAADDSFDRSGMLLNGDTTQQNANFDGSGSITNSGPTPLAETIGVPTNASGTYLIPVTRNGTATSINDYYPGGATPPSPLGSTTVSVAGTPASLPSTCPTTYSNVTEIDTNASSLDVIAGTITTVAQQEFNSNGLRICGNTTTTISTYGLTTGGLKETSVTTTTTALSSTSTSSAARSAAAAKKPTR